ncbi:toprim domain-containing protein [Candidatus Pacearchaeota archaeon]|nr:toprim domain-containing protein [Candidatus Pacearchaeota archaeon]
MKFNPQLKHDIEKYRDYVILVEGKKDVASMKSCGFERVYAIHKTSVSLRENVEHIAEQINRKDKVCILTDLNKKGKKLYMIVKQILQEQGKHLNSSFRGILIKARISHIEGIYSFFSKLENVG